MLKKLNKGAAARGGAEQSSDGGAGNVLKEIMEMRAQLQEENRERHARRVSQTKHLIEVMDEFLTTEANYCRDLRHTVSTFATPLSTVLGAEEHSRLFANISQILELHTILHCEIAHSETTTDHHNAAAAQTIQSFMRLLPYFKMYSMYWCGRAASPSEPHRLASAPHCAILLWVWPQ